MGKGPGQYIRLIGLSSFLEQQVNLDESLDELLDMAAGILNVANCSIMLFKEEGENEADLRLRLFANHGELPKVAFVEAAKVREGIAGHVASTGEALLVENIEASTFNNLARRPQAESKCFICVPILINRKVIGVINVSNPLDGRRFDAHDLTLATFIALMVGRSIQVTQLQNILKSRYTQLALIREAEGAIQKAMPLEGYDALRLAKILAKSFYRELSQAGLGRDHIVGAATEIISLLSENLARHDRRIRRIDPEEPGE